MKKNVIIVVLSMLVIMLFASVKSMSSRASYWMQRNDAAEEVLKEMIDSKEDYFLDVVMEGDSYMEWYNLGGNQ